MSAMHSAEAEVLDPVAKARALRPLLQKHAARCEELGRITDEVLAALRQAGLFAITAPRRAGGPGARVITHIETVAELAKGCAGTAWAYSLLSSVTASARSMPPSVGELVFRTGNELCCSVGAQTGHADPVADDEYVVSGKWGYASGCLHADWALNGVLIRDAEGQVVDSGFAFIDLHHPDVEILDTWHVAGMAGSGSNLIVAEGVRIPAPLLQRASKRPPAEALLAMDGLEPRDRWPMEPLFPLMVLAPMLGAAAAMLESVTRTMGSRPVVWWGYKTQKDSERLVGEAGQAAMEIDSAWLHVRRAAAMLDETAQERVLTGFDKARIQADCGYAMHLLCAAGNRLMDIAGPGAFTLSNPLQRFWRDLNMGTRHNALNYGLSMELYGRAITGLPSNLDLLPDTLPVPGWAIPL